MEQEKKKNRVVPLKFNLAFASGEITDAVAYQGFSFLIFNFYYFVIDMDVKVLTILYVLWSIYNAFNDPFLGGLSDKTRTKKLGGGRRRPWMIAAWIPLSLIMFFLFTPFATYDQNPVWVSIYFFVIICLFDTIYTAFSLNRTSLYPEMFRTDREREVAGTGRRIMMIVGLILAMGLPTFIVGDLSDPLNLYRYWIAGAALGVIVFITAWINIKWGIKEPPFEELEEKETTGVFKSIWITLKNWKFVVFVFCSMMNWFVFAIFPMVMNIFNKFVLAEPWMGENESLFAAILLLVAFLSSGIGVVIWAKIDSILGSKMGFVISQAFWVCVLIPLFIMIFNGIALGGSPYFIDRNISNIADEDELKTGQRREASFYGVHALIIRLSGIFAMLSTLWVLSDYGYTIWSAADVNNPPIDMRFLSVRSLVSWFPAIALVLGVIILLAFPLNKKEVKAMQDAYKKSQKSKLKKFE
jgi:GPH family glycoside/pentoside/hexuronide:cation symporter